MPTEKAQVLKEGRDENPDGHERDIEHLKNAEKAYVELALRYNLVLFYLIKKSFLLIISYFYLFIILFYFLIIIYYFFN